MPAQNHIEPELQRAQTYYLTPRPQDCTMPAERSDAPTDSTPDATTEDNNATSNPEPNNVFNPGQESVTDAVICISLTGAVKEGSTDLEGNDFIGRIF